MFSFFGGKETDKQAEPEKPAEQAEPAAEPFLIPEVAESPEPGGPEGSPESVGADCAEANAETKAGTEPSREETMQDNLAIIAEPEVAIAANEAEPPTEEAKTNADSATADTSKSETITAGASQAAAPDVDAATAEIRKVASPATDAAAAEIGKVANPDAAEIRKPPDVDAATAEISKVASLGKDAATAEIGKVANPDAAEIRKPASKVNQKPSHKLDSAWKPGAIDGQLCLDLTPDLTRTLLSAPVVDNKGPFSTPFRLMAVASGVKVEVLEGAGKSKELCITSPVEERLHRAKKYVRLMASADHFWTKLDLQADDDHDLTLLTCPEELWSWVLGKQDSNLLQAADDSGTLIFIMGKRRKMGDSRTTTTDNDATFQIAIFGDLHGRCLAQMRFMSAVDWKHPGYNEGKVNLFIPPGVDWAHRTSELPQDDVSKVIGTKGAIKRALCRASDCVIDYLGSTAHICGPESAVEFGMHLIEIVRTSKKKEIEGIPAGVEDCCDALNVPKKFIPHLAGKNRRHLDHVEDTEGVMIFLFKPPDDEIDDADADYDPENPNGPSNAIFVFAHSLRSQQRALLRLDRAVARLAGFGEREAEVSEETGVAQDIIRYDQESMTWLAGEQERRRRSMEKASGCAIEFFGSFVIFVGTLEERSRAKRYLDWLLLQQDGARTQTRAIPITASELADCEDLTIMTITHEQRESLLKGDRQLLDSIEAVSGTFICLQEMLAKELLAAGCRGELVCGGSRFLVELINAPDLNTGEMRLRMCNDDGGGSGAISGSVPLLIWGCAEGNANETGRLYASEKVRMCLAKPDLRQSVIEAAATIDAQDNDLEAEDSGKSERPKSGGKGKTEKGGGKGKGEKGKERKQESGRSGYDAGWDKSSSNQQSRTTSDSQDGWGNWKGSNAKTEASESKDGWGNWNSSSTSSAKPKASDSQDGWGNYKSGSATTDDWGSGKDKWQW